MAGDPTLLVVHSMETPLQAGYALSLARNWFGPAGSARTSVHKLIDPRDVVVMVPETHVAWHVGGANPRSLGYELAGRAAFSREDWTSRAGLAELGLAAREVAADAEQYSIPLRWASASQIRVSLHGAPGGLATHNDCRLAVGGTTHSDPGSGFPRSAFLDMVLQESGAWAREKRPLPHQVPWGRDRNFRLGVGFTGPRADALNAALRLGGNTVSAKTIATLAVVLKKRRQDAALDRLAATGTVGVGMYAYVAALTKKGIRP